MIPRFATLALIAVAACAGQTGAVPGWTFDGLNAGHYTASLDHEVFHGAKASATIRSKDARSAYSATLVQSVHAQVFLGRRVRLSAWVKANKAGSVYLWMRVEGSGDEYLFLDDMPARRKRGTFDWKQMSIVLDVLPRRVSITALLLGAMARPGSMMSP
jgi:hypothetical protein